MAPGDESQLLELLLEHGADVNFRDAMGNTTCIHAACGVACRCLQRLARLGVDLSVRNTRDESAFDGCRDEDTRIALVRASNPASCSGETPARWSRIRKAAVIDRIFSSIDEATRGDR